METDEDLIYKALKRIPVEPNVIKRSHLVGNISDNRRKLNLLSRLNTLPGFVLVAEDHSTLCYLSEEDKKKSITHYKKWMMGEDVDASERTKKS